MTITEYVGYQQAVTWNSVALEGLQEASLDETAGPGVEQIDVTTSDNTAYTYLADPWGNKGTPTAKFTAKGLASTASYADGKVLALTFNSKQALKWETEPGTANSNQYDHAALELTERVTTITWTEPYATYSITLEGTAIGAWSSPA